MPIGSGIFHKNTARRCNRLEGVCAIFYGELEVTVVYFTVRFQSIPGECEMNFDFRQERVYRAGI